jgi:hypothetical protein
MKKKILGVFVSLLVVVMLALSMSTAHAKKSYEVSGNIYTNPSTPTSPPKLAGINKFIYYATESTWEGGISGDTVGTQTWILHRTHLNIPDVEIFFEEATVDEKTGTLTIRMNLVASMANPDFPTHGNWRIIDATGGLEGLHGQGTWGSGWYEGTIHFDS